MEAASTDSQVDIAEWGSQAASRERAHEVAAIASLGWSAIATMEAVVVGLQAMAGLGSAVAVTGNEARPAREIVVAAAR